MNPFFSWPDSRTGIGGYQRISFVDALDMGKVSAIKTFQNKYVFIWESGTAIHDSVESPMTGWPMDGVETHAHYFDWLLQDKMLERGSSDIQTGLIILLVVVCVSLYFLLPGLLALLLALALPVLIIYSLRYSYDVDRVLFDIFPLFLAGSILSYPISAIYRFFIIDREKRQLKANFSHYVDPHVVDQIIKKWGDIKLGGDKKNVTVLFSDIAGFTTISEKLDPQNLFYLMSAYLSQMTDILIKEWGTLDKYIWDAVMWFFWAPLPYEDHSVRAARTALSMRDTLPDFNASILKRGLDPIDFRVGIASGEVMVGNIWSHDRFNYTVLGDTVNLASRLEWTWKEYNVRIILSAASKTALTPEFFVRELDTIAVKWKTLWVPIYELVGYSEDYVDRTMYTLYERALGVYRAWDYREAGKLWQSQAEKDPPSRVMMMRCAEILKGNLKIINGIYTMEHK